MKNSSDFFNEVLNHIEDLQKTLSKMRDLIKKRVQELRRT